MARPALALILLLLLAPGLLAAQADSTGPGVRFHLSGTLPALRIPPVQRLADVGQRSNAAAMASAWHAEMLHALDSLQRERQQAGLLRGIYGLHQVDTNGDRGLLGLGRQYADLAINGVAGLELRSDRIKNERCTAYQLQDPASGCQGHFTPPRLDTDFLIQSGGIIGRRLNIAVDYDSKRDFNANNDIRIFYQGLQDEIVQRIELGTVTFTPPPSRFITAAIPAYSFGLNTRFEFGPLTVGALAASQKGSSVTERTYDIGATTSQPQDRSLRDLDFEQGRFYWVVDPALVTGYPAVDILNLSATAVAAAERPTEVRVYRYRPSQGAGATTGLGGITAIAYRPDSPQRVSGIWQLLVSGQDYVLDPSGLWVGFANRLDASDYLAVSYTTAAGGRVGTFPSRDDPAANDSLLLVVDPRKGPEVPTFRYEMRQVYRVAGTDLDRSSLHVDLTLNHSESSEAGATYLQGLGIAIPTDPDVLDVDNRLFPRVRDPLASKVLKESYIVFPNAQPFNDATKLSGAERSDSLYRTPLYLLFTQGPPARFQFHLKYNAAGGGERNVIDLNAFQIRDGSEQITVGGVPLEKGVDYTISYELGQVTFLDPDRLFGNGQATVTARFEERGIFAVAPTTIYGLTTSYQVGQAGNLNFIGIYQSENTVFNRPPVGFEPKANLVGGVTGDFRFRPTWATRAMNALVAGGTDVPSSLDLNGEFAFTAPQANRAGEAFLEEFEGEGGLQVNLRENAWGFGSRPQHPDGLEDIPGMSGGLDSADAVQMTWQNLVDNGNGVPVQIRSQDIDSLIRVTGGAKPVETLLYVTMHADTAGGFPKGSLGHSRWTLPQRDNRPRWRSIVTSLSSTGTDLSQSEYLEFWLFESPNNPSADKAGLRMVVDLGTVGEDALAIAPESLTVTGTDSVWTGRRYSGVGRLDTEREPTGIFNAQIDDNGIGVDRPDSLVVNGVPVQDVATCGQQLSGVVPLFPWGDLGVRCTRGNGTMDTEDLNGDNVLDANGPNDNVLRYVVKLSDPRYLVRTGGPGWRLYRIPLRQPDDSIGTPNIRLVQHLRLTLAAPDSGTESDIVARFALARMRFLGSPWVRRSDAPVLGLSGATAEPHGEVVVSTVSTENHELGYEPPPGVLDEAARADATRGIQINERSLRVLGHDLRSGERAEGYFRFVAGGQNLLKYRTLKLWVRGRGTGWDDDRLEAVFKVASDDRNFYAFHTTAATTTWLPEVTIDLETWRKLRADIESRWLQGLPPNGGSAGCPGADSTAYVACDGGYMVQVADPGINPPNLASVQEIDAAVWYAGVGAPLTDAELWVDDVRLVDPINAVGTATAFSARLSAADVADLSVGYTRQDGNFQQIGADPTFRTTATSVVTGGVRLDRFLPLTLGISLPLSVSWTHSNTDPTLVDGTDLRASDLPGLRTPAADQFSWGLNFRRTQRGRSLLARGLIDPLGLTGNFTSGTSRTELSNAANNSYALGANYGLVLARRGPKLPLDGLVGALPRWLRESPVGEGLKGSRFTLVPTSVRFNSGLARNENSYTSYRVVVARPDDSLRVATLNLTHSWRNTAGLTFQPLGMLVLDGTLTSTRDLRHYGDSTALGRLAEVERQQFLGMDVGVERDRQVSTSVGLNPVVATWLRPRYSRISNFTLARNLTSRDPIQEDGDSGAFLLPQTYSNFQSHEVGVNIDLNRIAAKILGDSNGVAHYLSRLRPLDLSVRKSRNSTFDLATFDPSLAFVFAQGGRQDFLTQGGQFALGASEGDESRIGGGADLPGSVTLTMSYADVVTRTFTRVGDGFAENEARQREWPQGSLRWNKVMRRGPVAVLGLGATIRNREGTSVSSSTTGDAVASTTNLYFNPDMLLSLRNGATANLSFSRNGTVTESNANRTESVSDLWSGTVTQAIRLPASLSLQRRPLRASLTGQNSKSTTCLLLSTQPAQGCRSVADIRRFLLSGGFTTSLLPTAEAGLNLQYVLNDIRHTDQKTTQLSIVLSFRLQLSSGDLR